MKSIKTICQTIRNTCQNQAKESAPFFANREVPSEMDILPLIYLLPMEEITPEQYALSTGLLLTWLSRECHEKVTEESNKETAKAVLYGDLFYSLAYKVYETYKASSTIKEISEIAIGYNQAWFYRQDVKDSEKPNQELLKHIIKEDLGLLLEMTARKASEEARFSREQQDAYCLCSHYLSIIWAKKRYGYDVGVANGKLELFKAAQDLGLKDEFAEIVKVIT